MFTITITKTTIKNEWKQREWKNLGADPDAESSNLLGYTPQVKEMKEVTVKVLEQTVERLNLSKVIKAINGM